MTLEVIFSLPQLRGAVMGAVKVQMVLECEGNRVTITPTDDAGLSFTDEGGTVRGPDWSKWIQIAVCTASCLGGLGRAGAKGKPGGETHYPTGEQDTRSRQPAVPQPGRVPLAETEFSQHDDDDQEQTAEQTAEQRAANDAAAGVPADRPRGRRETQPPPAGAPGAEGTPGKRR